MAKRRRRLKKVYRRILPLIIFLVIMFMSVGYTTINSEQLEIKKPAKIRCIIERQKKHNYLVYGEIKSKK